MRVIAGRLRGRALGSVPGSATRPTTARARAGLFDALGSIVRDARVLDLYAGTGALGIEALSRGARHATFVERDRRARTVLRENLTGLDLAGITRVLAMPVDRAVSELVAEGERFRLVFADPPYGEAWLSRRVTPDAVVRLLERGGFLVVERDQREPPLEGVEPLVLADSRRYGETRFDRYASTAEMTE